MRGGGPAGELGERCGARAVDGVVWLVLWAVGAAAAPDGRPVVAWLFGTLTVATYETACVASGNATIGKALVGLRVRQLDRGQRVSLAAAAERGLLVAFASFTGIGALALIASTMVSPNRRGLHDRRSATFVVEKGVGAVGAADLQGWDANERPPPPTPFGPTASFDRRLLARLHRLDGAWVLLGLVAGLLWALQVGGASWLALFSLAFLAAFVVDETSQVSRFGGNRAHRRAGVRVLDVSTGRPPSVGRALVRALVLAPLLYVPPLPVLLGIWVYASPRWRGPHDLAARTVVVAVADPDPSLRPPPASAAEVAATLAPVRSS